MTISYILLFSKSLTLRLFHFKIFSDIFRYKVFYIENIFRKNIFVFIFSNFYELQTTAYNRHTWNTYALMLLGTSFPILQICQASLWILNYTNKSVHFFFQLITPISLFFLNLTSNFLKLWGLFHKFPLLLFAGFGCYIVSRHTTSLLNICVGTSSGFDSQNYACVVKVAQLNLTCGKWEKDHKHQLYHIFN